MNKIKFIWTLLLVLMTSGMFVSCDKDDIDEFTASVVKNPWISDSGEIYDFYSSFKGVIYNNATDYSNKRIDRSFIWTETKDELTIAIDGFRNEEGEMEYITGENLVLTTYHIESSTAKTIILSNGNTVITLSAYKNN